MDLLPEAVIANSTRIGGLVEITVNQDPATALLIFNKKNHVQELSLLNPKAHVGLHRAKVVIGGLLGRDVTELGVRVDFQAAPTLQELHRRLHPKIAAVVIVDL